MTQPAILILAAGASSRMGARDKLLEPIQGQPLLRRVAERACATATHVFVVLPRDRPQRAEALQGLSMKQVIAEHATHGMTASLRAGIGALPEDTSAVIILPADMPGITTEELQLFLKHHAQAPSAILRGCTEDGHEGHPALFPANLFAELTALTGDEGGRSILKAHRDRVTLLPLAADHAILDLDTPEDWAAYRVRESAR
ncbi:nucleotidyltransferase family protein [Xinfangfangia sp. CPCC 101601]|uniref:Nucleotidyltransferase family protein n=1 Tax=Pseudogemmobacter lacusdianii TaxID=3069608 RepID=A0ABU0VWS5_9RHOB|nr:nucleotidyltransferase family protein [Xinfangfangia sp. CPCC 101601]MDQ2065635.1 nucleotidyltransferase family protein [Xinfangfangia sp. CPCC 101601]